MGPKMRSVAPIDNFHIEIFTFDPSFFLVVKGQIIAPLSQFSTF